MFALQTARKVFAPFHLQVRAYATSVIDKQALERTQWLNAPLVEADAELAAIIANEQKRQQDSLVLIASENFAPKAVREALGTIMQNKYSEGYPGARYYGGNEWIDNCERLCMSRALSAFGLSKDKWAVNVQALSGSPANLSAYYALLKPHDRMMGLDLPHGGHLSHGYQTATRKVSAVSTYYETLPYHVSLETGRIDYDKLEATAAIFRPKLIVAGASAYSRFIDYARMRQIADSVNAFLLADISHWSGMIAAGVMPGPFEHAHVVTTTTHKTLRGPRGALIFSRRDVQVSKDSTTSKLEDCINTAVFPGHQGGPHNHTIAALAVALKLAQEPSFRVYQQQVLDNCQALAKCLMTRGGFKLVSDGTDTHLVLVDLRPIGINGARVERILELCNIAANKNTVPGDLSATTPYGLRLGTPAMTTRGFGTAEFEQVSDFIREAVAIALDVQSRTKTTKLADFVATIGSDNARIAQLRDRVLTLVAKFPVIG